MPCSPAELKVLSGFICCLIKKKNKKNHTGPVQDSKSKVAQVLILMDFFVCLFIWLKEL